MHEGNGKGWVKHLDFILVDIICLQLSFVLAFWILRGFGNPYREDTYRVEALLLLFGQLLAILFANRYSGILRRRRFEEAVALFKQLISTAVAGLVLLFMVHRAGEVSRLHLAVTSAVYAVLDYLARQGNKKRLKSRVTRGVNQRSIVLVTSLPHVPEAMDRLEGPDEFRDYFVSGVILLGRHGPLSPAEEKELRSTLPSCVPDSEEKFPILPMGEEAMNRLIHGWVDEVLLLQPEDQPFPADFTHELMTSGITVNYTVTSIADGRWAMRESGRLGGYRVLANGVRSFTAGQMLVKRAVDIIGGLVGCVLTGIIFLFIAPAIYKADPGPIFFTQVRIGKNGHRFRMHKFRSMYQDAEERKAALMAQNQHADGMMFKIGDDPRILGSEKKDKNGRPKGVGNFIRRTSLDEFPQFFDVLRGKMSLVGWRPCTLDEWEKYGAEHRIRAVMKPGVTGLWQVSGRSEITDFDEVVRLDRVYLENWRLSLDVIILIKTVLVVLKGRGAE
ncbi:MAG: sugar transferase [Lachnospiraceae bacterium]|nr:sugar transferase [Lachnospiraceae bacterium]